MTRAELRTLSRATIAVLTPPARAFERAKAKGYVHLDEQLGFTEMVTGLPLKPKAKVHPEQMTIEGRDA
jgi:hypothetical protein